MKNADYWRQRARINSDAAHAEANEYIAQLEDIYRDAVMSVKADLDRWYGRFADNNQITLAEARKRLTEGELEEFHWTVDKYIKAAEEHGLDPAWQKKLENASARYHISRLEAIQMQIQQQAELVYGNQTDALDELLRRIADNGYNHAAFDVMKGVGMGWDFTKLDQKRLDAMLKKPWTSDGKTFTDRCWEGKANLIDGIQRELVQSLMRGDSLVKTRDHIAQRFGVSKYKAGRLAHTEATYFNAVSTQACYEDLGVEKIEILETLDKHTCEICAAMDGKVIDKKDYQPGVTVPPFHPNCRGTTCPWFDDMEDVGRRVARDNEGEVYYVPPDMTYREWEKTFQEGGNKKAVAKLNRTGIIKLTKAEEAAVNRYISSDAYKVNAALRATEAISSLSQEMQSFIHDLDSALKKFPRYEGTVVRTLNFSDFSDGESKLNAFLKEHEVGNTVKSSQYLSTSKAGGYNPDAEVKLFILNAQKGRDITAFNPSENEVLFERESSFTVIQKKKVNGAWQIFLMEGE